MANFDDIVAKLDRANEHITSIESIIAETYDAEAHQRRYYDAEDGKIVFCVDGDLPEVPIRTNILCGECVHQLRSVLDHLIFKISAAQAEAERKWLAFPIFRDETTYAAGIVSRLKGVPHEVLPFIESRQPFKRGDAFVTHPLWDLYNLSNAEKHRFLLGVFAEAHPPILGVDGPDLSLNVEFFSGCRDGQILATIKTDNPELNVHSTPSIHVFMPDMYNFRYQSATDSLKVLYHYVRSVAGGITKILE